MLNILGNRKKETRTADAGVWLTPYGFRSLPEWNMTTAIEAYEKNPIVYACIRLIANEMARAKIRLFRETNGECVEEVNHPALRLLENPNPYQSAYEFVEGLVTWLELTGEAPIYLNIPSKEPAEAFLLDPRYIEIIPDEKYYIKGYTYRPPNGSTIELTPDEVVFFRDQNPRSQYRGHAPIRSARFAVDSDQFAEEWNRDFFNNNAVPRAVVTSDKELTDTAFNRLKRTWEEVFRGRGKSNKTAILEAGAKIEVLSQTAKDMDFVALGEKNIQRICAAFRVPKALLGVDLDLNRASAETMAYVFARWTITPKLRAIAEKLNNEYLPLFKSPGSGKLFFRYDDLAAADPEQKAMRYQTLFATGAISPNEIRREEGLEPVEGGDDPLVSAGLIPLGSVEDLADMGSDGSAPEPVEPAKGIQKSAKVRRLEGAEREVVRGIRDAKMKRIQKRYEGRSRTLFETQKKQALAKLDKWYASKSIEKRAPQFDDVWEHQESVALTIKLFEPLNFRTLKGAAADTFDLISDATELDFARARFAARKMTIKFADEITKTTEQSLRAAIQEGIANGEGAAKMADRVKTVFNDASTGRAIVIGRTETTKAYSIGTKEAMKQAGVKKKEWLTAHDSDVRDSHWENEYQGPIGVDETFQNGCSEPGMGDDPGENINCRCSCLPIADEPNEE